MADNIAVTPGTGATVAADDIGGVLYQRVKIGVGADGSATDVSTASPLPISDAGGSLTVDGTVAVSGSVAVTGTFYQATQPVSAVSLPLPTGAASETTLSAASAKLPATLGQKTMANSMAVALASDQGNIAVVSNNSEVKVSATFTRPADTTAYAAGDLVANSTTAGSVVAMSFTSMVRTAGDCVRLERARLTKTGTSLTNAQFRLHLFEDVPVPSVGDNAAFQTSNALSTTKVLNYIGSFSFTLDRSGSDGASGRAVPDTTFPITTSPVSGTTLYGLLEATAAYTPANAEAFVLTLEGFRT